MESVPPSLSLIRSRRVWFAICVALWLALLAVGRVSGGSCPAQDLARSEALPGLVLMAGEPGNPACTGIHRAPRQ